MLFLRMLLEVVSVKWRRPTDALATGSAAEEPVRRSTATGLKRTFDRSDWLCSTRIVVSGASCEGKSSYPHKRDSVFMVEI